MFLVVGRGLDFPDVTLVVQVGLPLTSDSYIHRLGRTARAGKVGRGVILLTEAEYYFISANRKLPITTYPGSADILQDSAAAEKMCQTMDLIDYETKQKAYMSYLGFMKGLIKSMKISVRGLVKMANELATQGMKLSEPPDMDPRYVR